ncbi:MULTISPECIES: UDP-N-acetylglucosamine 1-carboxyvinyltransferase [Selenomonas]|jgi:UDP-N-acetylglucosamine 1-carboxyvinyltransferase|uniref:UDP-N-acetylglucosamine 1-carboxyvinyltransferase n=1 Tax=Selenomonas artemidis F0399 TaxID=749551 RepID=E7N0V3_9FIRM|nr:MULTISPECIES: UDP-N-acetylglucosamine 1-carboxyvinyltransferase [Selenomonas]EFR40691.1 UDP-N-acetylglucosamine 1-carboxyvinyltransferase [Selenomonas sp. oral taxon 137 str. F0430]EFW30311.1 UDP-N-acetylglucosamine 1-carboxyvinyltransferase [Selenomonas artemidis F0399]EJP33265.1 UDP-N-acetylglucosamine 1-carboxyvinyltransferase [Selenomonas sp. FOBRC9]MBF1682539.1 UDP-N-acetylglucosamine 1-carboxyvinyltransferase [Selenomonas artemidis]
MEQLVIHGGRPLCGRVKIGGAKNAVLPIIAAALLGSRGVSVLDDVPALEDVYTISAVLRSLGVSADYAAAEHRLKIDATRIGTTSAPYELVRKMRASFLIMGPLLAREGRAEISLPGGCAIGTRPIDLHLKGFEALGAQVDITQGAIHASAPNGLKGANIYFDFPSVGATENVMMAASCAEGQTILENPAMEPEIVDLANYLNVMGAHIRGAGTNRIKIDGVPGLSAADYTIIPDRIEAGTYMVAAAMTRGDVYIENAISEHLKPVVAKLQEAGAMIEESIEGIRVRAEQPMRAIDLKTMPYPGFPTDMQAQFMAMLAVAEGTSTVTETVFENRFMHVEELVRMGAQIRVDGRTATVEGTAALHGAPVRATDLRAGAAMVLAGLVTEGETRVGYIHHIDRGYDDLVAKLVALGADIERREAEWTE